MRGKPGRCAPSSEASRASFRYLRPELLESRLALSHAPIAAPDAPVGQDASSPSPTVYYAPLSSNAGAAGAMLSPGQRDTVASQDFSRSADLSGLGGQASYQGDHSPSGLDADRFDDDGDDLASADNASFYNDHFSYGSPAPGGTGPTTSAIGSASAKSDDGTDVSCAPGPLSSSDASSFASGLSATSTTGLGASPAYGGALPTSAVTWSGYDGSLYIIEYDPLSVTSAVAPPQSMMVSPASGASSSPSMGGNSLFAAQQTLLAPPAGLFNVSASGAVVSVVVSAPHAGNSAGSNVGLAIATTAANDSSSSAAHVGPVAFTSSVIITESAKSAAPLNNAAVAALPIDGVRRTADAESVEVASIPSFLQRTPGATSPLGPQAGHFEHARPAKGAAGSADLGAIGPVVDMPGGDPAAALLTARESLLAGIAYNFEVVDHALETALVEIEKLGGNLAGWLDDADTFACAAAVTGALLAGGAYYHRQTRGARAAGAPGEDAASWLITHACAAAGLS